MPKQDVSISISPTTLKHGDSVIVSTTGERGVYNILCRNENEDIIYSHSGNRTSGPATLSSLAWTEGPASCVVLAREQGKNGRPYTAGELEFEVSG